MSRRATWSGRLPGGLAPEAWSFLHSLPYDRHLWADDLIATAAHVAALRDAGVLTATEARRLTSETRRLVDHPELIADTDEDVHSAIERVLTERLGPLGAKVHAGRSRNDQVATAMRLWTRRRVLGAWSGTLALIEALADRAAETSDVICPGYTHLQRAQPVTVGHWLCAHAWALTRDTRRFEAAYRCADVSVLGAGALAGSTLGLDAKVAAAELGFSATFDNTLDAVGDRDFLCDATYAAAMTATHLSRLAEDIVLWASAEFGFVDLPDAYATGSSMMPQKKNPDVAELARGQTGPAIGALVGLLSTLKGLPLAYDRDLQADKQNVGRCMEAVTAALFATAGLVAGLRFDEHRLAEAAADDSALATDVAEALVLRGVPFREAHERVGALARSAADAGTSLRTQIDADSKALAPLPAADAASLLDAEAAVRRRDAPGGPAPARVRQQARRLKRVAASGRTRVEALSAKLPS